MWLGLLVASAAADPSVVFESGPVRPLALADDGTLLVANLPDGHLDVLDPATGDLLGWIAVGLDPVAVATRGDRAWVVDHVSDSVSEIDLAEQRVTHVLPTGDEPQDIVLAGDRLFVTAAHRGRALPFDPQSSTPSVPRADVWVYDVSAEPERVQVVQLFGDSPRALAVSPDEQTVYAAVFRSGNRTTIVPEHIVCDGGETAPPCQVDGYTLPGGLPGPNVDADGIVGPETGLIVRHDGQTWRDALGRDWAEGIRFELPDLDVFALDAQSASVTELDSWSGVGTVLYALAVAPTGELLALGTEARNEVRFSGSGLSGNSSVRGHLHEARITRISGPDPTPIHLNPHIDYGVVPSPAGTADASIAQPVAMDLGPEGQVWIAGYGSSALAVHDLTELAGGALSASPTRLVPTLGGPSGVVIDGDARVVYVYARFDNAVQAFDLDTRAELWRRSLHSPEEPDLVAGRALFHDAAIGSSNGEASCGVCHVFGHDDGLAWDLGDPDGRVEPNPHALLEGDPATTMYDFHPIKGPMHTQTLRGIADNGALHWRGDRPDFASFADAFASVQGTAAAATDTDMATIEAWALGIDPPPNPYLLLDGSRTAEQQYGWELFTGSDCIECHFFDPAQDQWGTSRLVAASSSSSTQFMKVPSLRQAYTKLGLFWTGNEPRVPGPGDPLGPQVKGFGFFHDGAFGEQPAETAAAILAFPTNHAPAVGEQRVVDDASADRSELDELVARASAADCDLVAHVGARGWLWSDGDWLSDADGSIDTTDAVLSGGPVRFLCAPVGVGERLALDRDWDGLHNGSDNCPAVENPDQADADADGIGDACDPLFDPAAPDTGDTTTLPDPEIRTRETVTRGCGCTHAGPGAPALWLLLAALAAIRHTGSPRDGESDVRPDDRSRE